MFCMVHFIACLSKKFRFYPITYFVRPSSFLVTAAKGVESQIYFSFILKFCCIWGPAFLPSMFSGLPGPRINFITFRFRLDFQIEFIHQVDATRQSGVGRAKRRHVGDGRRKREQTREFEKFSPWELFLCFPCSFFPTLEQRNGNVNFLIL